ncbi:MAG: Hpt domain-containing protein [Gammaproteobacteria bacterium]|nr:response regulator [Rhodocyclaceae bacterium]MBU3910218.1 Hpt domain-containing protein [Gammaproteobacteria bacterium]MBU3988804.1 Hpt domain-containing protein [Gammaproteobacteria bacterium]MBU4004483.1 Hpt domain-containing protein [Gammaproteobacteria bacterium]MBU4022680.1 Hpt domain-containing protein [Gammaproteobacteria bacterium]
MNMATELDIGPLTWVKGEIDLACERASDALGQYAGSQEAKQIALARNQLRQARGALTIVGLAGVTQFAEAIEALLAGFEDGSIEASPHAVDAGRNSLAAIRHYLDDLVDGWPDQPLRLLPVYRELALARGLPEPAPAELFFPDLTLRPPRREHDAAALGAATLKARIRTARLDFQRGLLKWLKQDVRGAAEMGDAAALVEMTQTQAAPRGFWWATMAFFDALADGGIAADNSVNKLCGRIEGQLRKMLTGSSKVPDRLMRDVLYQVARTSGGTEHLESVRAAYRLGGLIPGVGETQDITPLKPLLRASRDLLASTKDHWNRYCAGTTVALAQFRDGAAQIAARVAELGQPDIARLAGALLEVAEAVHAAPDRHNDAYAIEVATALLLLEGALENFSEIGDEFSHQVDTVVGRLTALLRGEELSALELPQLDEMSRKAQERLLMHQVAKEILVSLAVIEQTLDSFFRNPAQRDDLVQLNKPLNQITGALTVLGQDRAVEVLRECGARIATFSAELYMPEQNDFEEVAAMLSGLGFFVEKLQFGAADIDAILNPAPAAAPDDEASESSVEQEIYKALTQTQILAAQLRSTPEDAQGELREELKQNLEALREDAQLIADHDLADQASVAIAAIDSDQTSMVIEAALEITGEKIAPAPVAPSAETVRLAAASNAEVDAELLSIFLEEGHEVLATIAAALPQLARQSHDRETLTTVRRSFHTLKGSGRMVGLTDLGEAAWEVEQTFNKWLQQEQPATPPLLAMLENAHVLFEDWVAQLETSGDTWHDATALVAECEHLRREEEVMPEGAEISPELPAVPEAATVAPPAEHLTAEPLPDDLAEPAAEPESIEIPELSSETLPELFFEAPAEPPPDTVMVGDREISRTLYELYLAEARGHVAGLQAGLESAGDVDRELLRLAHTLAGISATTGLQAVQGVAHALELAFGRLIISEAVPDEPQRMLLARAVGALDGMIGAIAELRLPAPEAGLTAELDGLIPPLVSVLPALAEEAVAPEMPAAAAALATDAAVSEVEPASELPSLDMTHLPAVEPVAATLETVADEAAALAELPVQEDERRQSRLRDELDQQLLPFFLEEAHDLMREIGDQLRNWRERPADTEIANQLRRLLHTLKGSARMAGAMSVGEIVHGLETRIEVSSDITPAFLDEVEASYDRSALLIDKLRRFGNVDAIETDAATAAGHFVPSAPIAAVLHEHVTAPAEEALTRPSLRVRADLVDKLVNEAGEIAIARARIEDEMRTVKGALLELTENVIRLRGQLREIEIQAESQMQSQFAEAQVRDANFDPLEFDRFTRFQELTRMMAESVNDVSTVQHNLLRNLDHADAALVAQARLNRDLSQALMSVRMVPFSSIADRLYRVVRQTAKELDKRVNLDIRGGQTELDRSVLEAMIGSIEHLLRNAVAHGIEDRAVRAAGAKPEIGEVQLTLAQAGNEVLIEMSDDGAGLDLERIRARAIEHGLLGADEAADDSRVMGMIFQAGFSTAATVSEVAGRGIGMDVVKNETANLGGRIEIESEPGQGARFRIYLPLTLAVAQVVLIRSGNHVYAIPSAMVEQVSELKPDVIAAIRAAKGTDWLGNHYAWHYIGRLLGDAHAQPPPARRHWLMLVKGLGAHSQRIALEVDALLGNSEVVVKNIGPQLARIIGIAGATVLGNGSVALIINPIALASRETVPLALSQTMIQRIGDEVVAVPTTPTVMVVDDSLTVRKITGRLLAREGYQVITAKDGVDALEQLTDIVPDVMLVDIEMPRMDGFDLTRNVRNDKRTRDVPIIMITSRIADKHRNYAMEIGVNHYLGKPYDEGELLALIAREINARPSRPPRAGR